MLRFLLVGVELAISRCACLCLSPPTISLLFACRVSPSGLLWAAFTARRGSRRRRRRTAAVRCGAAPHAGRIRRLMEPTSYNIARWAEGGWEAVDKAKQDGKLFGCFEAQDRWGRPGAPFPKRMEGHAAQRHGGRARPRSCAVCHWAPELEE